MCVDMRWLLIDLGEHVYSAAYIRVGIIYNIYVNLLVDVAHD